MQQYTGASLATRRKDLNLGINRNLVHLAWLKIFDFFFKSVVEYL
jgi:hypothetical protein